MAASPEAAEEGDDDFASVPTNRSAFKMLKQPQRPDSDAGTKKKKRRKQAAAAAEAAAIAAVKPVLDPLCVSSLCCAPPPPPLQRPSAMRLGGSLQGAWLPRRRRTGAREGGMGVGR